MHVFTARYPTDTLWRKLQPIVATYSKIYTETCLPFLEFDVLRERVLLLRKTISGNKRIAILDTGATRHVWKYLGDFTSIDRSDNRALSGIAGQAIKTSGLGDLKNGLRGVMYVPSSPCNIISLSQLVNDGNCTGIFDKRKAIIRTPDQKTLLTAFMKNKLWWTTWDSSSSTFDKQQCVIASDEEFGFHSSGYQSSMLRNRVDMPPSNEENGP